MAKPFVFLAIFGMVVFFPPPLSFSADVEGELKELRERVDTLEKRNEKLEKEVIEEHRGLIEGLKEHLTTLEAELDMVDYRTARIKALSEKVEAFSIGGDLTLSLQGVLNNSEGFREKADASYSADLFLIVPVGRYGNLYFRGDIGQGEGISAILPPTFSGPNADLEFDAPTFELVEAWYWTSFPWPDIKDQRVELALGKMDPTAVFDANEVANSETDQFVADIFVNNLAIEFGGDSNGYGAGVSIGYRFTSVYNKGLSVTGRVGAFEGDGDFEDVLDRPFLIAELDIWRTYYGLNGNYRFYGWVNNNKHTDLLDASEDELSNKGFGLSIDQQVSNDLKLFARYGSQDEDVSRFDWVWSVGGQLAGNRWKRGNDVAGFAYGGSHVSERYEDASFSIDGYVAGADYEHWMEAYYKYWANVNLSVSPDMQMIINPGGDSEKESVFIYGVRMQAAF